MVKKCPWCGNNIPVNMGTFGEYSDAQFEIILAALDGLAEPHYIECYYLLSGVVD